VFAARCLALSFLILAFAQPVIKDSNSLTAVTADNAITIYIDNSLSMEAPGLNGSKLDDAIIAAEKLVKATGKEKRLNVLTHNISAGQSKFSKEEALEQLATILATAESKSLQSITDKLLNQSKSASETMLIYSDFQKTLIDDDLPFSFDSSHNYYLIPIRGEDTYNVFVQKVEVKDPFIKTGELNSILLQLKNSGNSPAKKVVVKLFIENEQAGTATVDIEPNSELALDLNFVLKDNRLKRCRIEFNDPKVRFDNSYYFVIQPPPLINVMQISTAKNIYFEKVFDNKQIFSFKDFNYNTLDYSRFANSNLIVYEVADFKADIVNQLAKAVRNGASVFVYPGTGTSTDTYTQVLNAIGVSVSFFGSSDSLNINQTIAVPEKDNPFFAGVFEKLPQNMIMPKVNKSLSMSGNARPILKFKSNQIALFYAKQGKGTVYGTTFAISDANTTLPRNAVFLPIMYRVALQSINNFEKLAYDPGDKNIAINIESMAKDEVLTLKHNEVVLIPAQYKTDGKVVLEIPDDITETGFYEVLKGDSLLTTIALNARTDESILSFMTDEELQSFASKWPNVHVVDSNEAAQFGKDLVEGGLGTALWKYCIIAALFFILLEIIFIRFFTFGAAKVSNV
jgi:hypothetical protein